MSQEVAGGRLLAIPYRGLALGPELNSLLIEHLVQHPFWFAAEQPPDELRVSVAYMLTSPDYYKWEIWNGGTLAGGIFLHRVVPKVDALFHFMLLPHQLSGTTLFSARRLLWNFLGHAFQAFDLQRISAEVPEDRPKFTNFLRQRLAFKYEGELDLKRFEKVKSMLRPKFHDHEYAQTWVAAFGSRREHAHWNGAGYSDLMLLRLLRSEYDARASLGMMPQATRGTLTETSDVVATGSRQLRDEQARRGEARAVQPAGPAGHGGAPEAADRPAPVPVLTGRI